MPITVSHPRPHVALVSIDNQAKRNAMSRADMKDLVAVWDQLETSDVRAIVLTGAGDKAFCAGADVSGDLSASEEMARMINRALLKTSSYPKPIIAAVNGVCAGGGVELMLSCDIRVAASHARFGLPEVKWAIYPFGGATAKLVHQIGFVHAMKLLLTAEMIEAAEAGAHRSHQRGGGGRCRAAARARHRGTHRRQQPGGGAGGQASRHGLQRGAGLEPGSA
jgi:enoyl-CoA hydratase/carnithine racemase